MLLVTSCADQKNGSLQNLITFSFLYAIERKNENI